MSDIYQKSLILFKPDAIQRRKVGEIIARFERAGLVIHALKIQSVPRQQAEAHYAEHNDKPFFENIVGLITSAPIIAMVLGGDRCIDKIRTLVGTTTPIDALPGTIRGDYSLQGYHPKGEKVVCNLIHASANQGDASREINLWFAAEEVINYPMIDDVYLKF